VLRLRSSCVRGRIEQSLTAKKLNFSSKIYLTGWLPATPIPSTTVRLLFHSDSRTNEGGFSHPPFDELIEKGAPGAQ
jgi:ABC-type oligopeptide transport system substrate-binding subunit